MVYAGESGMATPALSRALESDPTAAPLYARRRAVAFGASLAFLSFLDRAAISQAAPAISRDLHFSDVQMGLIFSAFGITYAAFEIPSGRLCDRFGERRVLTRVVLLWSLFTAATGWAWSFSSMFATRLLFGAGESGCFPGLARLFRTWLPPNERNAAEGIKAASARWGAAITPALMAALSGLMGWRMVFMLFGAVGVAWAILFAFLQPEKLTPAKRPIAWRKLAGSRSVWALGLQWFSHYYGFYFYITWLPTYLYRARGLKLLNGAIAAGLPLFAAGLGSLAAGWALTFLTRRMSGVGQARKTLAYLAYGGAAVLLLLFTGIRDSAAAIAVLSLSSFAAELSSPSAWTTAMDIGGDHVGSVAGFMNTLGQVGASVAPALTGFLLAMSGNAWNVAFYCSAAIYAAGALCWVFIEPTTPLDAPA